MSARALLTTGLGLLLAATAACSAGPVTETGPEPTPGVTAEPAPAEPPGDTMDEPASPDSDPGSGTAEDEPSPKAPPSQKATPVPAVLDFRATTAAGRSFDGARLAGRPVLIWFWAPWCAVCRSEIPEVRDVVRTYGKEVAVLGVGSLDDAQAIRSFAAEVPGATHLVDVDGSVWRRFGIVEQSSFVLLDARGKEQLRSGYGRTPDLKAAVAKVVR